MRADGIAGLFQLPEDAGIAAFSTRPEHQADLRPCYRFRKSQSYRFFLTYPTLK